MHAWIKSACVVLAWSILPIILMAIGSTGSMHPAHPSTRTASSTEVILTSQQSAATVALTAAKPRATKYVVQYGDSLSSIATQFAVSGGWPALYAANRHAIGPDPNTIRPGVVLVLPSRALPARYTVAAGDTLSGIAARLALPGGWLALYEANWQAIGPDPNIIRPGAVLTVPRPAAPARPSTTTPSTATPSTATPGTSPAIRPHLAPPPPAPPGAAQHAPPRTPAPSTATGMPIWLKTVLLAVGLLVLLVFLAEALMAVGQRHRQPDTDQPAQADPAVSGSEPPELRSSERPCIIMADHDRLVVTCDKQAGRVFVLRPPGEDPRLILRVARVVLPEGPYGELAKQLGVPAIGPVD